jgi:uncharacterized protein YjbJ (UPF0337 family)
MASAELAPIRAQIRIVPSFKPTFLILECFILYRRPSSEAYSRGSTGPPSQGRTRQEQGIFYYGYDPYVCFDRGLVFHSPPAMKGIGMDKDRIKGVAQQAKGAIKEAIGKATGDAKLETEGKTDKAAGKMQNAVGGFKDTLRGK